MRARAAHRVGSSAPAATVHMPGHVRVDAEIQPITGVWWPIIVVGNSIVEIKLDPQQLVDLRKALDIFESAAAAAEDADRIPPPRPVRKRMGL